MVAPHDPQLRTLVVVSQTFAPAASVGAVRMTEWARHLPNHGWRTVVATSPEPGRATRPFTGCEVHELRARTGPGVTAGPLGGGPRARVRRTIRRAARLLLVPDAGVVTWRRAIPEVLGLVAAHDATAILTTGPPHSIHVVGLAVQEQTGIPWIMDVRDPFLGDPRFQPRGLLRLRMRAFEAYDRQVYGAADLVIHAHDGQRAATVERVGKPEKHVVVTNGFDCSLLGDDIGDPPQGTPPTVLVAGTIAQESLRVLAAAVTKVRVGGRPPQLRLAGRARDGEGIDGAVMLGWLDAKDVASEMQRASVLINALDEERAKMGGLSSKLFGYLASGRPILAVNPCAADELLLKGQSGVVVLHRPADGEFVRAVSEMLAGAATRSAADVADARGRFDTANLAGRVAALLDNAAVSDRGPGQRRLGEQSPPSDGP